MAAKNIDHEAVKTALIADGWTITNDPLHIPIGDHDVYIDLGVERPVIAAERGADRIAVEIQSFISRSIVTDFHRSVGQYVVYRAVMYAAKLDRRLYLAIPVDAYEKLWTERIGMVVREREGIRLIVYETDPPRIQSWIEPPIIEKS